MSKNNYTRQLETTLQDEGWQIVEVLEEPEWFAKTHWIISSIKSNYGLHLFLSFVVDPEDYDKKVTQVIFATSQKIGYFRPSEDIQIAELNMTKGLFEENLKAFVLEINEYREKA